MKKSKFLFCAVAVASASMFFSSCSKDDDAPAFDMSVKMVPISMVGGYVTDYGMGETGFKDAKYDANGRILEYSSISRYSSGKSVYSYTADKITISTGGTFSVKDGKISASNANLSEKKFSYDGNHIVSDGYYTYTWSGDNLVSMKERDYDLTTKFEYYDQPNRCGCLHNNMYSIDFINVDSFLALSGFYGNMPSNLLKKITCTEEGETSWHEFQYELNEYGYPTKITVTDDEGDVQIYDLTWQKL
ncbi:MAG: hypothetical protein DBY35_04165 [Bacteroidales bacterium]|nr:MAG: hypothetical protein DBY35_04165 [Bacteroidales bacterium]